MAERFRGHTIGYERSPEQAATFRFRACNSTIFSANALSFSTCRASLIQSGPHAIPSGRPCLAAPMSFGIILILASTSLQT